MEHKTARRVLLILLGTIFLGSACFLGYRLYQYKEAESIYKEAEELIDLPDIPNLLEPAEPKDPQPQESLTPSAPPEDTTPEKPDAGGTEEPTGSEEPPKEDPQKEDPPKEEKPVEDPYEQALRKMDFRALQEVNEDVFGWIHIPYTQLSYPMVQGEDNEYYLNHTWKKTYSSVGAIFLEQYCSRDLSDFNTIVYGHRMQDGSMFASLRFYNDISHWQKNPKVYVWDNNGGYIYEIFSAYEAGLTDPTYRIGFASDEQKQEFLDFCISKSVIETGITPTVNDQILTLSTCTGRGHDTRWVVQAVKWGAK